MAKIARPNKPLADVNVPAPNKSSSNKVVVCFLPDPDMLVGEGKSNAVLAMDASKSMGEMFGKTMEPWGKDKPNYVEMVAQKVGSMLCDITKDGKASAIYWALGPGGEQQQEIGSFDQSEWASANFSAPKNMGTGTKILPAINHANGKTIVTQ